MVSILSTLSYWSFNVNFTHHIFTGTWSLGDVIKQVTIDSLSHFFCNKHCQILVKNLNFVAGMTWHFVSVTIYTM